MAADKRYTTEQIVAKLPEAEKLQGQGLTIPQLCKRLGVSDQPFYRWRLKYGAPEEDEAQPLGDQRTRAGQILNPVVVRRKPIEASMQGKELLPRWANRHPPELN